MTVKELMDRLENCDPAKQVVIYHYDGEYHLYNEITKVWEEQREETDVRTDTAVVIESSEARGSHAE